MREREGTWECNIVIVSCMQMLLSFFFLSCAVQCCVALHCACTFACTLSKSQQHIVFTSNCNQHDHYNANVVIHTVWVFLLRAFFSSHFFSSLAFNHTAFLHVNRKASCLCIAFHDWEKKRVVDDGKCNNAMYRLNDVKWWIVCRVMGTK